MRREQIVHARAGQRIDDEEMRGRRVLFGRNILDLMGGRVDFRQRRGKPVWSPADLRAHIVGGVFTRPADRHLHEHGGERSQYDHRQRPDHTQAAVATAVAMAAAEKHPELRQHRDGTGNSGSDRHQDS